ncbi:MAG: ABC transporter permease subunit [Synergistaceae bacterium]|jgi:molybdate transport system permease protein|nr:ABC transporter permease subunit [Synergistaceae bacterium]
MALSFPILLSLRVCVLCLALFIVLGLPLAYWGSRSRSFASRTVSFFITLPLVFPPIAMGFMLLTLLGRNGPIGRPLGLFGVRVVFSQFAVVLAAFIAGLPMVARPLQAAMEKIEVIRLEEAARTAGCGPLKAFLLITIPQVGNTLVSGLLLGVARASGEVGITMMIGGNIAGRTNTLSLEIYNSVSRGDFDAAMRLCAILAVVGLVLYVLLEKYRMKEI